MKAFIELELLLALFIVIIIVGTTFGLTVFTYNKLSFESSTRQLLTDIEFMRYLSVIRRETLTMEFYPSLNYYRFETVHSGFGKTNCSIKRSFNESFGFPDYFGLTAVSYIDEDGGSAEGSINFGGSSSKLTFYPDGTPSSGGHIVLYSKRLNKGIAIIVKPVTGRARIGKVIIQFGN